MQMLRHPRATLFAQAAALAAAAVTLGFGLAPADASTPKRAAPPDPAVVEAAAAAAEARRGTLGNGESPAQLRANAFARCRVHEGEARAACEALVRGEGRSSGSVAGGGVLREIVTRTVGAPDAPAAPATTATPAR